MATKQGGLLINLGKRLLGFNTSSSCCAAPTAEATKTPEVKAVEANGTSCCAPSCCAADTPVDARRA
jgi:hypothetical protein